MIPNRLRRRILVATLGIAAVICVLFSVGLFAALEYAEWVLFDKHIESDIRGFIAQYRQDPGVAALPHHSYDVFVTPAGDVSGLPAYLRGKAAALAAGDDDEDDADDDRGEVDDEDSIGAAEDEDADEVIRDGHEYHLDIRTEGGTTFYFLFDETEFEAFDQLLNAFVPGAILLVCALAGGLGVIQANRISRPVTALADRVNRMETAVAPPPSGAGAADEIELLSRAIDGLEARVAELLAREREFSTDVSHELRTPLMGIQAAAENLQVATATPDRVRELSARIEARCAQMRALVDAMLSLARDPQSLENDFSDIALADAVHAQIEIVAPHLELKGLKARIVESGRPRVHTSAAILDVVIGNLLRNAIFHSQSAEIEVQVGEHGIRVRDFGRGIPEDMRDRLFDRYASSGGPPGRDLGVGLALVKRICAHFRWRLDLESVPGNGTTISVDFGTSLPA